jgi:hypothetical protein
MEKVNVEAVLRGLSQSVRQVKALLAWQELEETERKPGQPPSFRIDSHVEEDLRNEYSFFVKMALDLAEFLNREEPGTGAEEQRQRQRWKERLSRLEEEVRKLGVGAKLIRA